MKKALRMLFAGERMAESNAYRIPLPCKVHARDGQATRVCGSVHACSDAVVTNVWQWTRVLWRGGNCLLRQASRTHIDLEDVQRDTHTQNTLKFHLTPVELLVAGLTLANLKLALRS